MTKQCLLDTDVMIDFLRGYEPARILLEEMSLPIHISTITVAELYAGVREGKERDLLEKTLTSCKQIAIDSEVASRGGLFSRTYSKSHGVGLADAMIAATAVIYGLTLITLNKKHFPMLNNVITPYKKHNK